MACEAYYDIEAAMSCDDFWDESSESDYLPDEFPISDDDLSSVLVDEEGISSIVKGKRVRDELEESYSDKEIEGSHLNAPEMDTSDEEFHIARENVREFRAEMERRIEEQLSEYEATDDDMEIISGSEDVETKQMIKRNRNMVTVRTDCKKLDWKVGLRFPNMNMFKEVARMYGILNGFSLKFGVCDKKKRKIGIVCKKDCPFRVYASWHENEGCLLVKSVVKEHRCVRDMQRNRLLTSKWLAKQYLARFKDKPQWPAAEIIDSVRRRYGVIINPWVAYKAKAAAYKMLHGSMKDHYNKVGRYIEELKISNKGGRFELLTIPSSPPIFQRFFVCFPGLKNGLIIGCRRFICLDGCFLKTFLRGILLAAIGRDANNQMFPICWAVVEGETRDSWEWFLNNLKSELNGTNGEGWTFMSDQQKGLLAASASVFPKSDHRNCARHIYANWKKKHKGDELKISFWRAVRAYTKTDFEEAMEDLKKLSPLGAKDFLDQDPRVFCRSFFSNVSKCDVVVNNMAETFNNYILRARGLQIIDMLESIRSLLMERHFVKHGMMIGQEVAAICPRVKLILEEEKKKAWDLLVTPSSITIFQVRELVDVFKVDMENRNCTCRKWDITGIPCCHAAACCGFMKVGVEIYVHDYYKKGTYLMAYEMGINPCVSQKYWPKKEFPLDPPPMRALPGRPPKNRRKDPHEDPKNPGKLTKHGIQMKCSRCSLVGHNKKRCPKNNELQHPVEKRPRGRPRKNPTENPLPAETSGEVAHTNISVQGGRNNRGRGRGKGRGRGRESGFGVIYGEGGAISYRYVSGKLLYCRDGHAETLQEHGNAHISHASQTLSFDSNTATEKSCNT